MYDAILRKGWRFYFVCVCISSRNKLICSSSKKTLGETWKVLHRLSVQLCFVRVSSDNIIKFYDKMYVKEKTFFGYRNYTHFPCWYYSSVHIITIRWIMQFHELEMHDRTRHTLFYCQEAKQYIFFYWTRLLLINVYIF